MKVFKILLFLFCLMITVLLLAYFYVASQFNLNQFIIDKTVPLLKIWKVEAMNFSDAVLSPAEGRVLIDNLELMTDQKRDLRIGQVELESFGIDPFLKKIIFGQIKAKDGHLTIIRNSDGFTFVPNVIGPYPTNSSNGWKAEVEKIILSRFKLEILDNSLPEPHTSEWFCPYFLICKDHLKDELILKGALCVQGFEKAAIFISCRFHLKDLSPSSNIEVWGSDLPVSIIEPYQINKTHLKMNEGTFNFRLLLDSSWDTLDGRIDFIFSGLNFKLIEQHGLPSLLGIPSALWVTAVEESKGKLKLRFNISGTYEKLTFQMHDTSKNFFANLPHSAVKGGFKIAETIATETVSLPFKIIRKPFEVLFGKKEEPNK